MSVLRYPPGTTGFYSFYSKLVQRPPGIQQQFIHSSTKFTLRDVFFKMHCWNLWLGKTTRYGILQMTRPREGVVQQLDRKTPGLSNPWSTWPPFLQRKNRSALAHSYLSASQPPSRPTAPGIDRQEKLNSDPCLREQGLKQKTVNLYY